MSAAAKVSAELQVIAGVLERRLAECAGQKVAFSLFVWTDGRANYVSTADRGEVIAVLEAMLDAWKKGMPDVPAHKVS